MLYSAENAAVCSVIQRLICAVIHDIVGQLLLQC